MFRTSITDSYFAVCVEYWTNTPPAVNSYAGWPEKATHFRFIIKSHSSSFFVYGFTFQDLPATAPHRHLQSGLWTNRHPASVHFSWYIYIAPIWQPRQSRPQAKRNSDVFSLRWNCPSVTERLKYWVPSLWPRHYKTASSNSTSRKCETSSGSRQRNTSPSPSQLDAISFSRRHSGPAVRCWNDSAETTVVDEAQNQNSHWKPVNEARIFHQTWIRTKHKNTISWY